MKQHHTWLLTLLSILTFLMAATTVLAEEATVAGHVEVGISGMDTDDNPARVNEFVKTSNDDDSTVNPALDLGVEYLGEDVAAEVGVNFKGADNFDLELGADVKRIFKFKLDYQALEHWKDHETLDQMGATGRTDILGGQPNVTTDKILAELQAANGGTLTNVAGSTFPSSYPAQDLYEQELSNEYIVTRHEIESEVDLTVPSLPNIIFHAGLRIETRDGMEQAISLSKCQSCHVSAVGKNIDERTEDFTIGATGKFGRVTVDYEYLTRDFSENGAAPSRYYYDANQGNDYQLIYGTDTTTFGELELSKTPDSEKDSHSLKARVDITQDTSIIASYVKSEVESSKDDVAEYDLENGDTLKTEFESFGGKLATKFGNWRLSLKGSSYEIEADHNEVYFPARDDGTGSPIAAFASVGDVADDWHTAEASDVNEIELDAVYRIKMGTTLRLGLGFEEIDREEDELGDTETITFKAALKSRINKNLSGRFSYKYQDIDEPFAGAKVGIAQGDTYAVDDGSGLWYYDLIAGGLPTYIFDGTNDGNDWYWTYVYPNRQLESSNQPDEVHEAKASATWTAKANLAATIFARVRMEENSEVDYEQATYVPGFTFWYAPNNKMNLTMAYTFNRQETENKMCVGWYHG
ncbi:MAG: MtrB/PioB family outer membrane beta-barrel protein [Desulfuromonadales bacterium]|nr:MtrB/PioB family outer membrane beta-barrel protein [Desulfuromonadales bacterium]MBN2793534.1 MtrB/PioB family outer membrane beta-barrel protein [Desulfuromonadales bacterium]